MTKYDAPEIISEYAENMDNVECIQFHMSVFDIDVDVSDVDVNDMIERLNHKTWPDEEFEQGDTENEVWTTLTWETEDTTAVLCWLEVHPLLLE